MKQTKYNLQYLGHKIVNIGKFIILCLTVYKLSFAAEHDVPNNYFYKILYVPMSNDQFKYMETCGYLRKYYFFFVLIYHYNVCAHNNIG